jgi:hypothetical protein
MEERGGVEMRRSSAAEHKKQREMELSWVKRNAGAERTLEKLEERGL